MIRLPARASAFAGFSLGTISPRSSRSCSERLLQQHLIFFVNAGQLVVENLRKKLHGSCGVLSRVMSKTKRYIVEQNISTALQQRQRENGILDHEFGFVSAIDINEVERFRRKRSKPFLRGADKLAAHCPIAGLRDVRIKDRFERRTQAAE